MTVEDGILGGAGIVCVILAMLVLRREFKDSLPKKSNRKLPDDTQGVE
jgi:hypothetical protein